jgi:hypothetical protein
VDISYTLAQLADQAEALKVEPYDSPKVGLWKTRARKVVEEMFGEDYLAILNEALRFGFIISGPEHGRQQHHKAMDDAATFLRALESEAPAQ